MSQNSAFHKREDVLQSDPLQIHHNAAEKDLQLEAVAPKPRFESRYLTRVYFRTITVNGQMYSKCLVENCGQQLRGSHLENLSTHLMDRHQLTNLFSDPKYARNYFELLKDGDIVYNKCLVENCGQMLSGNHLPNLKTHLLRVHKIIALGQRKPKLKTLEGSEDATSECKTKYVRNYFKLLREGHNVKSKCLVRNCGRILSGNHLPNLKTHLLCIHKIGEPIPLKPKLKTLEGGEDAETKYVRNYFESLKDGDIVYNKCLVENCGRMLSGNCISNLKTHLLCVHKINAPGQRKQKLKTLEGAADAANECKTKYVRNYFELLEDGCNVKSKCLVENCGRILSGNHLSNLKTHLLCVHKIDAPIPLRPKLKTLQGAEEAEKKYVRDYFKLLKDEHMINNECLVENCGRILSGNHLPNLKTHLLRVHKINAPSPLKPKLITCRLCFRKHDSGLDIFLARSNIAAVIRQHFPTKKVSENDGLPNVVCTKCWTELSHFHQFHRNVVIAEKRFLEKRKNEAKPVGNDRIAHNTDEIEIVQCKDEPPETEDFDENSQFPDNEVSSNCPFDNEDFSPEATTNQRDFDTVFLEEFETDGELKTEKEAPVEVFMEQPEPQESIAVAHIPVPSSSREKRKSPRFANEPRKRPAESINADLTCSYCGESFLTFSETDLHYKKYHFISKLGDRENSIEKRVKRSSQIGSQPHIYDQIGRNFQRLDD